MLSSRGLHSRSRSHRRSLPSLAIAGLVFLALAATACAPPTGSMPLDRLTRCTVAEGPTDALCGRLAVYENRASRTGRQINLNIVVIPAVGRASPDPLFFLAGGPGQAAAQMAAPRSDSVQGRPARARPRARRSARYRQVQPARLRRQDAHADRAHGNERVRRPPAARVSRPLRRGRPVLHHRSSPWTTSTTSAPISATTPSICTAAPTARARRWSISASTATTCDRWCSTAWRRPTCGCRCTSRATRSVRSTSCVTDCEAASLAAEPRTRCSASGRARCCSGSTPRRRGCGSSTRAPASSEEVAVTRRVVATVIFGALYSPITASLLPELIARAEHERLSGPLRTGAGRPKATTA